MSNFKTCNRHNPCPVCNSQKTDCRYTLDGSDISLVLCKTNADGPSAPGWHYLGYSANSLWGKFVPKKDNLNEQEQIDYEKEKSKREAERLANQERESERIGNGPKSKDRDAAYQAFLPWLTLEDHHLQSLKDRGLTSDQIRSGKFKSVKDGVKIPAKHKADSVPGVLLGAFRVSGPGFIVPIFNHKGMIIGAQVRFDEAQNGARYKWSSTNNNPRAKCFHDKLNNGELPITFCTPDGEASSIGLCEGHLKPYVAAKLSGNTIFIGAAGGQFVQSKQQLEEYLKAASERTQSKVITFYPDAEAIRNKQVLQRNLETLTLVESLGYEVLVADWGHQFSKDDLDIDELLLARQEDRIRKLSLEEYRLMVQLNSDLPAIPEAVNFLKHHPKTDLKFVSLDHNLCHTQHWLNRKPGYLLHREKLGDISALLGGAGSINCIKSPTNTGKTTSINEAVIKPNRQNKIRTWILTHRKSLSDHLSKDTSLPTQQKRAEMGRELWAELGGIVVLNSWKEDGGIGLDLGEVNESDILIDEAVGALYSLLLDSTFKDYREAVLSCLKQAVGTALNSGGRLFLLDARLDDLTIGFFTEMFPDAPVTLIVNEFKQKRTFTEWQTKTPAPLLDYGIQKALEGENVAFLLTAAKASSKYGSKSIEFFLEKLRPQLQSAFQETQKTILVRSDSESYGDIEHFASSAKSNPDKFYSEVCVAVVSPVVCTGVSLNTPNFDVVIEVALGNTAVDTIVQQFARCRYECERHLWVAERSMGSSNNPHLSLKTVLQNRKNKLAYTLQALRQAGHELDLSVDFGHYEKTAAEFIAREQILGQKYRESVLKALEIDGFVCAGVVDNVRKEKEKESVEKFSLNRAECVFRESEAVVVSPDISNTEAERLKNADGKTYSQCRALEKHTLKSLFKMSELDVNFVFLAKMTPELHKHFQNYFYAKYDVFNYVLKKDLERIEDYNSGAKSFTDLNTGAPEYEVIRRLELAKFLDPDISISEDILDDFLAKFLDKENNSLIRSVISGLSIKNEVAQETPVKALQTILRNIFGVALVRRSRKVNGKTQWYYEGIKPKSKYEPNFKMREKYALARWQEIQEKIAEENREKDAELAEKMIEEVHAGMLRSEPIPTANPTQVAHGSVPPTTPLLSFTPKENVIVIPHKGSFQEKAINVASQINALPRVHLESAVCILHQWAETLPNSFWSLVVEDLYLALTPWHRIQLADARLRLQSEKGGEMCPLW